MGMGGIIVCIGWLSTGILSSSNTEERRFDLGVTLCT